MILMKKYFLLCNIFFGALFLYGCNSEVENPSEISMEMISVEEVLSEEATEESVYVTIESESETSSVEDSSSEETTEENLNISTDSERDFIAPTSFNDPSIFFAMQQVDASLYMKIENAYKGLDLTGDYFEYGDEKYADIIAIYDKFMSNELECLDENGNGILFGQIEDLDTSNGYEYELHEMTRDSVPELCIRTFYGNIFIFWYDAEADCLKIWKAITDTSYYVVLGNGNIYWSNLRGDYQFMHFNEAGEMDLLVTMAIPYDYSEVTDSWENVYLVTFPECSGYENELSENDKAIALSDGTRYYFRVSEEQFKKLTEKFWVE